MCFRNDIILYSESQGRLLVSVNPSLKDKFEGYFKDLPISLIGTVRDDSEFIIYGQKDELLIHSNVDELNLNYRKTLNIY